VYVQPPGLPVAPVLDAFFTDNSAPRRMLVKRVEHMFDRRQRLIVVLLTDDYGAVGSVRYQAVEGPSTGAVVIRPTESAVLRPSMPAFYADDANLVSVERQCNAA
jgi:hypothetical protein